MALCFISLSSQHKRLCGVIKLFPFESLKLANPILCSISKSKLCIRILTVLHWLFHMPKGLRNQASYYHFCLYNTTSGHIREGLWMVIGFPRSLLGLIPARNILERSTYQFFKYMNNVRLQKKIRNKKNTNV